MTPPTPVPRSLLAKRPVPGTRVASYGISLLLHSAAALAAIGLPVDALRGQREERLPVQLAFAPREPASLTEEAVHEPEPLHEPEAPPLEPVEPELELETEALEPPELDPLPDPPDFEAVAPTPTADDLAPLPLDEDPFARVSPWVFAARPPAEPAAPEEALPEHETVPVEPPGASQDERAPELLSGHAAEPPYPARAERLGWEGAVVLRITVGADGRVAAVAVEASSGHALLDESALEAARTWRFRPGTRGGEPAAMDVLMRFSFELDRRRR